MLSLQKEILRINNVQNSIRYKYYSYEHRSTKKHYI